MPLDDRWRAYELLLAHGYQPGQFQGRFLATCAFRYRIEVMLVRQNRAFPHVLELHWAIFRDPGGDRTALDELWAQAHTECRFGVQAYAPTAEWLFVILMVHAARHRWQGLKWLIDLDELCRTHALEWNRIEEIAHRFGWGRLLGITLATCRTFFQTPVPHRLGLEPLPSSVRPFVDGNFSRVRGLYFQLRLLPNSLQKLRYLLQHVFIPTPAEWACCPLPPWLAWLYVPLRPLRLVVKWGWPFGR